MLARDNPITRWFFGFIHSTHNQRLEGKMKKLALSLITCLSMVSFGYAATSALTESLLEYEAITSAIGTNPEFQDVIPVTEFIIDIKRITRKVNILGQVKYEIVTRVLTPTGTVGSVDPEAIEAHSHSHKNHIQSNSYIAILNVTANPGIGPNIVTVVSITPSNSQHIFSFSQE